MEPVIFKRWSNKKWAVLATFHKVVLIGSLSFAYNILASAQESSKADSIPADRHLELEEVDIVETAPGDLELLSLLPVEQIRAAEISSGPALSHDELLEHSTRIDIRQRGMHGTQSDVNIQGGSFDQGMVLLNGFDLSDPQTGHFHLNLPLDMSALHMLEIQTGTATRKLGTRAFSGAVNFITRPADSIRFQAGAHYGQHNLYKGWMNLHLAGKTIRSQFSASSTGSTGYRPNTDFRNSSAFFHSVGGNQLWKGELMAGANFRKFGANAFYTPRFPEQYEETQTAFAGLRVERQGRALHLALDTYYRTLSDHFLLDRHDPSFYQNDHISMLGGLHLKARYFSSAGITHSALHFRWEYILSTSLGYERDPVEHPFPGKDVLLDHDFGRLNLGWSLNHSWNHDGLSISGGFRLDFPDLKNQKYRFLPGIEIRYRSTGETTYFAGANRSLRMPTFTDLFYMGPANVGNPELLPEEAVNLEVGLEQKLESFNAEIRGFYRRGRNMIDWIWMEDEKWHTTNLGELDALGGTALISYLSPGNRSRKTALKQVSLSYTFTELSRVSEEVISHYLLDNLKHKLQAALILDLPLNLALNLKLSLQDRNGSFMLYDPEDGSSVEEEYEAFWLADARLNYSRNRVNIFIQASNLFHTSYYDIGNVPQPGRWVSLGIAFR